MHVWVYCVCVEGGLLLLLAEGFAGHACHKHAQRCTRRLRCAAVRPRDSPSLNSSISSLLV